MALRPKNKSGTNIPAKQLAHKKARKKGHLGILAQKEAEKNEELEKLFKPKKQSNFVTIQV